MNWITLGYSELEWVTIGLEWVIVGDTRLEWVIYIYDVNLSISGL